MQLHQIPADGQRIVRVLIVEDEPMIAMSLEDVLIAADFEVAGVVGKLDKALALIDSGACDAAIVDANLAGVSSSPAAMALNERGLPYIVISGYSPDQMQGNFPGAKFLEKPCRPDQLIKMLNSLVFNS